MIALPGSIGGSSNSAVGADSELPVTGGLTLMYAASLMTAALVAFTAVAGLFRGSTLYQTEEMLSLKLPTDLFTLVVGLPILLGTMCLAQRGRLIGLLCWPGALLYELYIYVAYAIGVPFGLLFPAYVLIVAFSAYTTIALVASIDAIAVRQRLSGLVPERLAGGVLAVLAVLFTLMNLAQIATAIAGPSAATPLEAPVWIADSAVLAPAWLIGGLLLWQRKALGYVGGAGLLLVGSMLFVGVIFALVFPAFYAASPVDVGAVGFILAVGSICFVPLTLFARGVVRSHGSIGTHEGAQSGSASK